MKVCVFCSSKKSLSPSTFEEAKKFCAALVDKDMDFVYGGGCEGLMGYMADEVLSEGGNARGVFPKGLFPHETAHHGLTELVYTEDLMDRKRKMMEMSDAFVIFPGGLGTLDEAIEVITWRSLNTFDKPIIFFNHEGFWDSFKALLDDYEKRQVLYPETMESFVFADTIDSVFERLNS